MLKGKLHTLERKISRLTLNRENYPESITIRVIGCFNPRPEKILKKGAIPIYYVCKSGGPADCKTCKHYDLERLQKEQALNPREV